MAQPMSLLRDSKAQGSSRAPCSWSTNGLSTTEERRRHKAPKQARTENNFPSCAECGRAMLLLLLSPIEPVESFFASVQVQVWKQAPQMEEVLDSAPPPLVVPALPSPYLLYLPPSSFLITGSLLASDKPALTVPLVHIQLHVFLAFLTPGYYGAQYNGIMC